MDAFFEVDVTTADHEELRQIVKALLRELGVKVYKTKLINDNIVYMINT